MKCNSDEEQPAANVAFADKLTEEEELLLDSVWDNIANDTEAEGDSDE